MAKYEIISLGNASKRLNDSRGFIDIICPDNVGCFNSECNCESDGDCGTQDDCYCGSDIDRTCPDQGCNLGGTRMLPPIV